MKYPAIKIEYSDNETAIMSGQYYQDDDTDDGAFEPIEFIGTLQECETRCANLRKHGAEFQLVKILTR